MRNLVAFLTGAAVLAVACPSSAQTRMTIAGGGLIPFGDLGDVADPSFRGVLRAEYQPVNALGQASPLAFLVEVAYTDVSVKSEVEAVFLGAGFDVDPYLLEVGGGVRVYSREAPFFVSGGVAYARERPAGTDETIDGLGLHGGVGFLLPAGLFLLEPEASAHVVLQDGGDLQFLVATLGIALPF